ncbi:hypothetical protein N308_05715, partial [Struthio camelus australis]
MSPSSVEITCCCLRGFFLGEAPGGKSLCGIERLLANNARDGDTVLVVKGGTAEIHNLMLINLPDTGRIMSIGSTSSLILISGTAGPSTAERAPLMADGGAGAAT